MLSVIHFRIIWTYGDSVGFNVYVLACAERLNDCTPVASDSLSRSLRLWRGLDQFWLGQGLWPLGPSPHHRKSAIQQQEKCHHWGLTNYTRHLRRKLSEHLGWERVLGWGKGKTEEWKKRSWKQSDTCLLFSPVSRLKTDTEHSLSLVIGGKKVLDIHQAPNMINCVLPGNPVPVWFDKIIQFCTVWCIDLFLCGE